MNAPRHLVIAHLFPARLNLYGDGGNVDTLARRAGWRGIDVEVRAVDRPDPAALRGVDVIVIGGGADQHQGNVAESLRSLGQPLREALADGASLLAVCAGYQLLGHVYRSPLVGELRGPGLLDVETEVPPDAPRAVGGLVIEVDAAVPLDATHGRTVVGFENHSGRTTLGPSLRPLGRVIVGHGNDDTRTAEGAFAAPGDGGLAGLRIATYLHGPVLPRNPHLADLVLASGLGRGEILPLSPLPDELGWLAHDRYEADWTAINPGVHATSRVGRAAERLTNLIGF